MITCIEKRTMAMRPCSCVFVFQSPSTRFRDPTAYLTTNQIWTALLHVPLLAAGVPTYPSCAWYFSNTAWIISQAIHGGLEARTAWLFADGFANWSKPAISFHLPCVLLVKM